jgi:hypothetical protein
MNFHDLFAGCFHAAGLAVGNARVQRARDPLAGESIAGRVPDYRTGFLRISAQPAFGLSPAEARRLLREWKQARQPVFVPCDLTPLEGDEPPTGGQTTDYYLASLAAKHGMVWATLDGVVRHPASFLVPE